MLKGLDVWALPSLIILSLALTYVNRREGAFPFFFWRGSNLIWQFSNRNQDDKIIDQSKPYRGIVNRRCTAVDAKQLRSQADDSQPIASSHSALGRGYASSGWSGPERWAIAGALRP